MDLLIVGGGISGLTHAYKYLKKHAGARVLVVEKSRVLGGRCRQIKFGGIWVPGGAGVGRLPKDRALFNLVKELTGEAPYVFKTTVNYYKVQPIDLLGVVEELKSVAKGAQESFEEFFVRMKGKKTWTDFCSTAGYTDFAGLNVRDALYNYGFDDVVSGEKKFYVPWNKVVDLLETKIQDMGGKIMTGTTINSIVKDGVVELTNGTHVAFKDYMLCVPPKAIRNSQLINLLTLEMRDYIRHVKGQPFCYVYAMLDVERSREFVERFKSYTVVPAPMQKIIPMSREGVYMICYSDNQSADYLKKHIKNPQDLEDLVKTKLGLEVKIKSMKVVYWDAGTHYRDEHVMYKNYKHLKGEAFALNQGWTNGGL